MPGRFGISKVEGGDGSGGAGGGRVETKGDGGTEGGEVQQAVASHAIVSRPPGLSEPIRPAPNKFAFSKWAL